MFSVPGRSARQALRRPSRSPGELLALNDLKSTLKCYLQRRKGDPVTYSSSPYTHLTFLLFTIFLFNLTIFQVSTPQSAPRICDFFFLSEPESRARQKQQSWPGMHRSWIRQSWRRCSSRFELVSFVMFLGVGRKKVEIEDPSRLIGKSFVELL